LSSRSGRKVAGRRRWGAAVVFAVIAVLPPIAMFETEAGAMARVLAILHLAKNGPPSPLSFGAEVYSLALAWAMFFGVLALIYAIDTKPVTIEENESEDFVDDAAAEPGPEVRAVPKARSKPEGRPADEPKDAGDDSLPVVHSLPEAQAWLKKGSELHTQGRYDEAIAHFDKALKLYPRLASAWAGKGLASNGLGQYEEAIRCYDESLRLDPRDAAAWHDKANTLCAVGRLEGGLLCYNEALIIDPRNAKAWNNKGICLASLGRPEEAVPCCDKAIALDPSYATAWHAKAVIEERLGRIQDAVVAYERFIALAAHRDAASVEKIQQHLSALAAGAQTGS
jgi:tetratricopeptide (TPR) repeat protein